jgi:PAS domain S-box-containing protein
MGGISTRELDALQRHSSMLFALLNDSTDSIYFKDHLCRFVMVSRTKAEHLGLPFDQIIGKTDYDFLPQDVAQRAFEDDMRVIRTGQVIELEEEITRPDNSFVWNSVKKAPWRNTDGDIIGVFGITRDITVRKRYEQHILDMLSIATHDIRSPLASMGMTIKLLMRGSFGPVDESVRATLEDLYDRSLRLERIVTDYLGIAAVQNVRMPSKETLDLREDVIDPVLHEFADLIEKDRITIDNRLKSIPSHSVVINANRVWLMIVYRTLIGNAIKYGGKGCTISFGREDHGDKYVFNVWDSGPGVPPDKREKIFEKFESTASTGLGLAISRDLIEKHGGNLWYEHTGRGHPNFKFSLPK